MTESFRQTEISSLNSLEEAADYYGVPERAGESELELKRRIAAERIRLSEISLREFRGQEIPDSLLYPDER